MKNILLATSIILLLFQSLWAQNNVGIGVTNPDVSSILELSATDKGLLLPRMTNLQRNAIATPANGLMVYDTDNQCFYFYETNVWKSLCNTRFDSITVTIATFDTLFANVASFDTLFSVFARFDSLFSQFASFDTLFSNIAFFDSIFAHIITTDTLVVSIIQVDSIFAQFGSIDTLFSNIITTDSLIVNGQTIQDIINNSVNNTINGNAWLQIGNGGTNPTTNFLGTTDNQDLSLRTNNSERLRISAAGNIGVGTSTPDPSAAFEIASNSQGILVPRLTTAQRISILNPANGLYVYDITINCFFSFSNLSGWVSMCPEPKGIIVMWSGTLANIPVGYALCDGSLGTPDLRDRFVLSVSTGENPGAVGGIHNLTLTSAQMPAHFHSGTTNLDGIHSHSGTTSTDGNHFHSGTTSTNGNHLHAMNHTHTINDPGHSHTVAGNNTFSSDGSTFETDNNSNSQPRQTTTNTTGISVNTFNGNTATSGDHTHNFSTNTVGAHAHSLNINNSTSHSHTFQTNLVGGGASFDNRPAFYKLAFIMKL